MRRRINPPDDGVDTHQVDEWVGTGRPRQARKGPTTRDFARAVGQVIERLRTGDWQDCTAIGLVALYSVLHERCYGVAPSFNQQELQKVVLVAHQAIKREGGVVEVVHLIRWTWQREVKTEKWRRDNGRPGGRVTWQNQFMEGGLLTDYRVARSRGVA